MLFQLGTVGFSLGITSSLSAAGKLIIIALMYIGRIGVITFTAALIYKIKASDIKPKSDDLAIGLQQCLIYARMRMPSFPN